MLICLADLPMSSSLLFSDPRCDHVSFVLHLSAHLLFFLIISLFLFVYFLLMLFLLLLVELLQFFLLLIQRCQKVSSPVEMILFKGLSLHHSSQIDLFDSLASTALLL